MFNDDKYSIIGQIEFNRREQKKWARRAYEALKKVREYDEKAQGVGLLAPNGKPNLLAFQEELSRASEAVREVYNFDLTIETLKQQYKRVAGEAWE